MLSQPITKEILESNISTTDLLKTYFNDTTSTTNKNSSKNLFKNWIDGSNTWTTYSNKLLSNLNIINSNPGTTQVRERIGCYGKYYGGYINEDSNGLGNLFDNPDKKMLTNINYIATYLKNVGWHPNTIAAILGNIYCECGFNPGNWEGGTSNIGTKANDRGYGLVQWTSAWEDHYAWCMGVNSYETYTSNEITNIFFSDPSDIDVQLAHLVYDLEPRFINRHWYLFQAYPGYLDITRDSFIKGQDKYGNTRTIEDLAKAFMKNYLRPGSVNNTDVLNYRARCALEVTKYVSYLQKPFVPELKNRNLVSNPIEPFYNKTNSYGQTYKCTYNGNCTWYAYGRTWELNALANSLKAGLYGDELKKVKPIYLQGLGNAGYWYNKLKNNTSFPKNRLSKTTPKLGAVVCWKDPNRTDGWGHVAVIEKINYTDDSKTDWVSFECSNSGYPSWPFYTYICYKSNTSYKNKYTLEGFIYNEYDFDTDITASVEIPINQIYQEKNELKIIFDSTLNTTLDITWHYPQYVSSNDYGDFITTDTINIKNKNQITIKIPPFSIEATIFININNITVSKHIDNMQQIYPCIYLYDNITQTYTPYIAHIYTKNKWYLAQPTIYKNNWGATCNKLNNIGQVNLFNKEIIM